MIEIDKVKRYSIRTRYSKVASGNFARIPKKGSSFLSFYNSLPGILKAKDLHAVVEATVKARRAKKAVIFMAGAHVIKCGLNPILIELLKKRIITCVCLNGAGIIHDFEIAFQGKTSEEVAEALATGRFGMAKETADFINQAVRETQGKGLGYAVARKIAKEKLPFKDLSLLYEAYKLNIPVAVFVAIGTDIIHQHPSFDAGLTAQASLRDFYLLTENISCLNQGGVVLNFGSAVILPEVFLKALNLARNLGHKVKNFTAANFDMIYHYRPAQNIVSRPTLPGGRGYYIIGHHEIMLPLFSQAVMEKI
jgi:translation initiation factor 1 (eIF-1/SUI1)